METTGRVVKGAVKVVVGLMAAELFCIAGNALITDGKLLSEKIQGVVAKPVEPEPKGFFHRKKK